MSDWQPVETAEIGVLSALRFRDPLGSYESEGPFFLHDDGRWYAVSRPALLEAIPTHWRPSNVRAR